MLLATLYGYLSSSTCVFFLAGQTLDLGVVWASMDRGGNYLLEPHTFLSVLHNTEYPKNCIYLLLLGGDIPGDEKHSL
jgi:hypothetical protein